LVLAHVLGFAGILGSLLLLANAKANGTPLSFGYLLNNLGSLRQSQFDALTNSTAQSLVSIIGTYLGACAFLNVIAAIQLGRTGWLRPLAVVNFLLMASVSLLVFAGRATLFNIALLALVSIYLLRKRIVPRNLRAAGIVVVALVGVWYFAVPYLTTREGARTNPVSVLAETQRAELRPSLARAAADKPALGIAFVSLGYFTSPVATLSFYVQQDEIPGPLWGAYSFPLPDRTVAKFRGTSTPDRWLKTREKVFMPLEKAGYFPNVWATWLRDLLADFGYLGAILFSAVFGMVMARARNAHERTARLVPLFIESLACLTFAFGAFTGVLWNSFLSDAFFLCLALSAANGLRNRSRSATASTLYTRRAYPRARRVPTLSQRPQPALSTADA
jgi:hypothetical protein